MQAERLEEEIQQAIEEKDTYKARDKMNALRKLAEGRRRLAPERRAFDALVDECRKKLANAQKDGEEKRKTSAEIDEAARGGYEAYDAEGPGGRPGGGAGGFRRGQPGALEQSRVRALRHPKGDFGPDAPATAAQGAAVDDLPARIEGVPRHDRRRRGARRPAPGVPRNVPEGRERSTRRELKGIINSVNPFTSDEECEPLFKKLRTIYGKWSQVSNMDGAGLRCSERAPKNPEGF